MTVQLYHNPHSRAVMIHALLEEIGCPYELKHVDYEDGSMRTPEFLALNPMGKVPVLVDGDTVVTETGAIAIYLADKYKSPNDLAPGIDDPRRGDYLRWIGFQSGAIEGAMTQAGAKFDIMRQQAGWGSVELVVDVLDDRLAKADPWLLGDWFTAADVLIGAAAGWAMGFGLFPSRPNIAAYLGRVMARPAFQKVMPKDSQAAE